MTRGQLIKKFRKKKRMTQEQLAQKCGMATITIRQYESEKRIPQTEQLVKVARALQVPVSELWGEDKGDFLFDNRISTFITEMKSAVIFVKEGEIIHLTGLLDGDNTIDLIQCITHYFDGLNEKGKMEAVKRVKELTQIQEYHQPTMEFNQYVEDELRRSAILQEKPSEGQINPADS